MRITLFPHGIQHFFTEPIFFSFFLPNSESFLWQREPIIWRPLQTCVSDMHGKGLSRTIRSICSTFFFLEVKNQKRSQEKSFSKPEMNQISMQNNKSSTLCLQRNTFLYCYKKKKISSMFTFERNKLVWIVIFIPLCNTARFSPKKCRRIFEMRSRNSKQTTVFCTKIEKNFHHIPQFFFFSLYQSLHHLLRTKVQWSTIEESSSKMSYLKFQI